MLPGVSGRSQRPILVAGPNLAVDRTIEVPELVVGGVHRATAADARAGGKGVNVARALACIGQPALVTGFVGGRTGEALLGMLADEGIACEPVRVAGESRSCLIVLAPGSVTVLNEEGPTPDPAAWRRFEALVTARLDPSGRHAPVLVVSGSFPPGAGGGEAAGLVRLARERGCPAVCDLSGVQLERALAAGCDLATPNLAEAEMLLGMDHRELVHSGGESLERAAAAAVALLAGGPEAVLVTAGAAGAALAWRDGAGGSATVTRFPAPEVAVRNPIGAGDSLTAGVAAGFAAGAELEDAVRTGMGAAAASCETFAGGLLDPARAQALSRQIRPQRAAARAPGRGR